MTKPHLPLAVCDLRFRYSRRGEELFGGLSHEFAPGAVTAVTGASGRGKSTLLYVLGLLLRPSSGQVRVDGRAVSALPDAQRAGIRAATMGFVFQDAVLDPGRTVLDAVIEPALYRGLRRGHVVPRAHELLERLGVAARATHRPGQVSGGQAQRVALCRALLGDPAVILADEPTGNLDADNAGVVLGLLGEAAAAGATVAIATHDPGVVAAADQVVAL